MKKHGILVFGLIMILSVFSFHQSDAQTQQNVARLSQLSIEYNSNHERSRKQVEEYTRKNNIPLRYQAPSGNYYQLQTIDALGLPVYYVSFNQEAAVTTGASALHPNGSLGLNLAGDGMLVGIWDSGRVDDHDEFEDRLSYGDGGADITNHATHVTGTIIAAGFNENARGMAFKARGKSYDWTNDASEMATEAAGGLLVSNHSYGVSTGWDLNDSGNWVWRGANEAQEDYKFGFYSSKSKSLDNIAFNAPNYTIVWAAGNDRNDVGDGSRPADGPFDSIGPEGTAKNIITVGAVSPVSNYQDPGSVVMSTFSSWGPTDDGRIKPDLVGAGVGILSTLSGDGTTYGNLSGTSMASPNVAGSLLLLQELYGDLNGGQVMRASTLKGLAIHTAKEAGIFDGPDYQFGWGVLDVEAGAELLLGEDGKDIIIDELTLNDGQVYEMEFLAQSNEKITATICWTDPSGNPTNIVIDPTTLMLVNDLDVKLIDDAGNEILPWTMNPSNPNNPAVPGDNFRDNVEKIEFKSPEPRVYKLQVSHKNSLQGGSQNFSLILTAKTKDNGLQSFYWIGDTGDWNNGANWSNSSGGAPANAVPGSNDRVFFDENSFASENDKVTLSQDITIHSFAWLDKQGAQLDLDNFNLLVNEDFEISGENLTVETGGQVVFNGDAGKEYLVNLNGNNLSGLDLIFQGEMTKWTIDGIPNVNAIQLESGEISFSEDTATINEIITSSTGLKIIDFSGLSIGGLNNVDFSGTNQSLNFSGSTFTFDAKPNPDDFSTFIADQEIFDGTLEIADDAKLQVSGSNEFDLVSNNGLLSIVGNNTFGTIQLNPGSTLEIESGTSQFITNTLEALGESGNLIQIASSDIQTADLNFDVHKKICLDFLEIENIKIDGAASVNAGLNSTLNNAENWFSEECDKVLFADFSSDYNCVDGNTQFNDLSSGEGLSWQWDFGDTGSNNNTSTEQHPTHDFSTTGDYNVSLIISDGNNSHSYILPVSITANDLEANNIIENGNSLFSVKSGSAYQWYKNGELIPDAIERSYLFNGEGGSYYVVTFSEFCSMRSETFVITGIAEEIDYLGREILLYPNPNNGQFVLELPNPNLEEIQISVFNAMGQIIKTIKPNSPTPFSKEEISLNQSKGIYFLNIQYNKKVLTKRLIIQ